MKNNIFVDLHVLQTVPPSCINRDETGSPKNAIFGGVTRARVSSQAWKHVMRKMFPSVFDAERIGIRTKHIPENLAAEIIALDPAFDEEAALAMACKALTMIGKKGLSLEEDKDTGVEKASALFFISKTQLRSIAKLVIEGETNKKCYQDVLKSDPSMDMVLFGRMVADDPSINFDAAAQVAHAISTHAVEHSEYDYFTAHDDCSSDSNAGACHVGLAEFNSSTLYRYATVNASELMKHLDAAMTKDAILGFVESFIYSMPSGKQNSFANRTVPDMVYITVRADSPVNMSGAFEKPITAGCGGFADPSESALISYAKVLYSTFLDEPVAAFGMGAVPGLDELATVLPRGQMLKALEKELDTRLEGVGK